MSRECRRVQELLALSGPTGVRDDAAAEAHLAECSDCFATLEAVAELDRLLGELATGDAPDAVVEQLLDQPELRRTAASSSPPPLPREPWRDRLRHCADQLTRRLGSRWPQKRRLRWLLAASSVAAVVMVVLLAGLTQLGDRAARVEALGEPTLMPQMGESHNDWDSSDVPEPAAAPTPPAERERIETHGRGDRQMLRSELYELEATEDVVEPGANVSHDGATSKLSQQKQQLAELREITQNPAVQQQTRASGDRQVSAAPAQAAEPMLSFADPSRLVADDEVRVPTDTGVIAGELDVAMADTMHWRRDAEEEAPEPRDTTEPATVDLADANDAARRFLAEREQIDGIQFVEPRGYWSNTYVPGDPALRLLQSRLLGTDLTATTANVGKPLQLHRAARQPNVPLDPPEDAALAVSIHADRRGVVARERMIVQVGLQATERRGGRRLPMNLGIVLDLRGRLDVPTATTVRALVEALEAAHDLGDRFTLVVAGRPGGVVVPAGDFRHGPLLVALDELLDPEAVSGGASLAEAFTLAHEAVAAEDDPSRPLGSSSVMLVVAEPVGAERQRLLEACHASAVGGVPVSVIGVGGDSEPTVLEQLALAGQGSRRLLNGPEAATSTVTAELNAVSEVVARAVRLNIRLAPGVQLVDVIGSEPLDAERADAVRTAEESIDRRLAQSMGIAADRGLDEDGIQIVIPAYLAGDAHVILLDVIAPGPGPVADVTARYKDLVMLRNGVARANLTLGYDVRPPGALQRAVLKSLLAHRLAERLSLAADAVRHGDPQGARRLLGEELELLRGLRGELPDLADDPDLARDIALLEEYRAVLEATPPTELHELQHGLADSLELSGNRKLQRLISE